MCHSKHVVYHLPRSITPSTFLLLIASIRPSFFNLRQTVSPPFGYQLKPYWIPDDTGSSKNKIRKHNMQTSSWHKAETKQQDHTGSKFTTVQSWWFFSTSAPQVFHPFPTFAFASVEPGAPVFLCTSNQCKWLVSHPSQGLHLTYTQGWKEDSGALFSQNLEGNEKHATFRIVTGYHPVAQ